MPKSRAFNGLVAVIEATRSLASAGEVTEALAILARELTLTFDASACMVSSYDPAEGSVTDWAGYVQSPAELNRFAETYALSSYPTTRRVLEELVEESVTVGSHHDPREEDLLVRLGYGAALMAPLVDRGEPFGLVEVFDDRRRRFSDQERSLCRLLVDHAAIVLSATRLFEHVEYQDLATVAALANALEAKDAYTGSHAAQIADLAVKVGEWLGLQRNELRTLRMGGLLHDVGKIGIAESILQKPGRLTDDELVQVRRHTVIGAHILEAIPGFADVIEVVRASHERWDGAGYPDGLTGAQIPLGARIIAVCDAFHAMTEDRVYRRAMSVEGALKELRRCSDTQFWPPAVAALERVIHTDHQLVRYAQEPAAAG
jgi:HD-GYP domain-containing protein (c-di-GMP phosphodiesterase class II)